jgi:hypothetical protein
MDTYSVFVHFRKGGLALRRKIASLEEAVDYAEAHQAVRHERRDDIFVVVDGTGESLTVADARAALARQWPAQQFERLQRARRAAARQTERAALARERAIVACERARTISALHPAPASSGLPPSLDWLIELTDRAALAMKRSIALMEERLATQVSMPDVRRARAGSQGEGNGRQ